MTLFRIFPQVFCPECGVQLYWEPSSPPPRKMICTHSDIATDCPQKGKRFSFEWPTIKGTEVTQ